MDEGGGPGAGVLGDMPDPNNLAKLFGELAQDGAPDSKEV